MKARLSQAVDAAALAGGRALQTAGTPDNAKVTRDALAFFDANFPNGAMGVTVNTPTVTVGDDNTSVTIAASASVPATLMRLFGSDQLNIAVRSKVAREANGLDVAFAFDITGSMCKPCSKIAALRDNAKALVDSNRFGAYWLLSAVWSLESCQVESRL